MGFLFGGGNRQVQAASAPAFTGIRLQTSVYGLVIPIVYGQTRIQGNLIWYGDFKAIPQQSGGGGGGGGGKGGGGGGSGGGATTYTYQAAVAIALCEGTIANLLQCWNGKAVQTLASMGFSTFLGTYPTQTPWGYLTTFHAGQDLGYQGLAYAAAPALDLGTSPDMPNLNFEAAAKFQLGVGGRIDADPKDVVTDFLTNADYGAGFPSARLGSLTTYSNYCISAGLLISPAFTEQKPGGQALQEIVESTNSAFVWSSGLLTIVPYGDQNLAWSTYSYTAPSAPLYDLADDDFLTPTTEDGPVTLVRTRPADAFNVMRGEFSNRANQYNPEIVEAKDQNAIELYGQRTDQPKKWHFFCDATMARTAVQLLLQRQNIRNNYTFTLGWKYILLDPMDIVSLTDAALGLNKQWVRITEITEDEEGALTVVAEEYLAGTGAVAIYSFQQGSGYAANFNVDPGNVNAPIIFEPPGQLAQALEIFAAVSGANPNWGGAECWASSDNATYTMVGTIGTPSRMGALSAALPSGAETDTVNTLSIDLTESRGTLLSGTQSDADRLVTLCYADGEWLAYKTATLTAPNKYDLAYLVRGAYGSPIGAHLQGAPFTRVDQNIVSFPFSSALIGHPLYLKFVSFNIYGGGKQSLATVPAYTYYPTGLALYALPADVQNLTSNYLAGLTQLFWDAVPDFRLLDYEVRLGTSWNSATFVGRTPTARFIPYIDGNYLVSAHYRAPNGDDVYSANAASIAVVNGALTQNILATHDEAATGWGGTLSGYALNVGGVIELGSTNNILADSNFLTDADVLWGGGVGSPGTYQVPTAHRVNVGRPVACTVLITTAASGVNVYAPSILTMTNILSLGDILASASGMASGAQAQVRVAQADAVYGAWQNYLPGAYTGQYFDARIVLTSSDPQVTPHLSGFIFSVDVPDREDSGVNVAIAAGGTTITYSTPFNGGPGAATTPLVHVTIKNAQAGDLGVLSGESVNGFTYQVMNGGSGVARNVNWSADGY
jgi:hypothetical protein